MSEGEKKEETVTLDEFLKDQENLEKEAAEILPGDIDKCTYFQGYIKQPVYGCMTCRGTSDTYSGFCFSCSISCHSSHDVIELFDKRNFRCDCGNSKFANKCKLVPEKDEVNEQNKYDHNYENRFCYCNEIYEPEKAEDTMFKCIICEDWFHEKCLIWFPDPETWKDLICSNCSEKHPVFSRYVDGNSVKTREQKTEIEENLEPASKKIKIETDDGESKEKDVTEKPKKCPFKEPLPEKGPKLELFLVDNWQESVCRCVDCTIFFINSKLDFLFEDEDDNDANNSNEEECTSTYQGGMKALEKLPRNMAMEAVSATQNLYDKLKRYLEPFASEGRVVTKEDIQKFFEQQKQ